MTLPKRVVVHDSETCHKCQRGRHLHLMSEDERREICNELAGDGWDIEYLSRRFDLEPKGGC